jgi:hypothetical protein
MSERNLAQQIDTWSREAVAEWGDDWVRVAEHIRTRTAALSQKERDILIAEAALTLCDGASAPVRPH